jgi:hypothetical protein
MLRKKFCLTETTNPEALSSEQATRVKFDEFDFLE